MNRFRHLLLLALMGLITACSYNELPEDLVPQTIYEEDGLVLSVETRAETYKGQALDQEYFVTAEDLENFVKFRRSASKRSDFSVKEVKSYGFDSSQTLFYILNYNQGWEVVSADKRVQPTLAHGDSGEFTMECDNEAMKLWMNMLADGILQTRLGNFEKEGEEATASAESKESTDDPQSDHTAFWNAISPTKNGQTRFEPLTPIPGPGEGTTYTYIVDVEETITVLEQISQLLETQWGQNSIWAFYCPRISSSSLLRAPAGCVPVAGAQLLYYLSTSKNWPLEVPGYVFCEGDVNSHSFEFDNFNSQIWNNMALNLNDDNGVDYQKKYNVARLLAYIGDVVEADYGVNSTSAYPSVFIENMQNEFDMRIDYETYYDESIVLRGLYNNMPVVMSAQNTTESGGGHMWLIDGYRKVRKVQTFYVASFSYPQTEAFIATLDKDDADYNYTTTTTPMYFHMNWGWNGGYNGYYYSVPTAWIVGDDDDTSVYSDIRYVMYNYVKY